MGRRRTATWRATRSGADSVLGVAAGTTPALGSKDLVVVVAEVKAGFLPGGEVVGHGDGTAAGPLADAVGDVLPEGGRTRDGGLVDLLVLPDLVGTSVTLD